LDIAADGFTATTGQQAKTANGPNYATIAADVAEWQVEHVERIRKVLGDEYAADTEKDLTADPWLALQWYVEDTAPVVARTPDADDAGFAFD